MDYRVLSKGIVRSALTISLIALSLWLLFLVRSVMVYVCISMVITLIGSPIVSFLNQKLKIPNKIAVAITIFCFIGLLLGIFGLLIPLIIEQSENLSLLNTDDFKASIETLWARITNYFSAKGIDLFDQVKQLDLFASVKDIPNFINYILSSIGSFSVGFLSVIFISFFLLKDGQIIRNKVLGIIPKQNQTALKHSFYQIKKLLSRYFIGLIIQLSILFLIYTTTLLIFSVKNAIIIALICCLLNLIPFIGPLIAGALMCILTMSENLHLPFQTHVLPLASYVMGGFLIAQLIDYFFSQPFIFSKSVHSHPLEIFLIILCSGFLFGIVGMMIAVPSYTVIKVIIKCFFKEKITVKSIIKYL